MGRGAGDGRTANSIRPRLSSEASGGNRDVELQRVAPRAESERKPRLPEAPPLRRRLLGGGKAPPQCGRHAGVRGGRYRPRAPLGIGLRRCDWAPKYFIVRKMSHSPKTSVTGVPKSDSPHLGKGHKVHLSNTVKTKGKQQNNKDISAHTIQRVWLSHLDKSMFQLLKRTICAAFFLCSGIAFTLHAKNYVNDLKYKEEKFSGETFPPFIVFKIFLHTEGLGYKYFSGKSLLKPSSEVMFHDAVVDACKIMGKKKFYHQIMEDERLFQKFKITDEIDIVTLKDYMQVRNLDLDIENKQQNKPCDPILQEERIMYQFAVYSSLLDEIPASSGGRNNYWRRLNLENIPRTMIMYDIVDYAESGIISNRLKKEMKYLVQRPKTEEMRQHQLRIVSQVR
ncbi:hypothetical protein J1605_003109 [Eschrichtius robustus]|uniref:Uncharacterized protein n=1 Tax=Eschrichtius robustus TaxID=9764 RepID=A0AB34HU50_ESCRO|nr:hypothetical protein J1605_003109 [Eschrichtius robustus]